LSQIQQSQPKKKPNFSKEKALISFDFLVRFEPFQRVVVTPPPKKFFLGRPAVKDEDAS
jgi:hypothetical protein